jgi:hypothetical protein
MIDKLQEIIDRIAPNYVFSFYTIEDIKQEAYWHALTMPEELPEDKWEQHLKNRLSGWKRSKYNRPSSKEREDAKNDLRKR